MKTNVQRLISMAILGLALFSNTAPVWAGFTSRPEVTIYDPPGTNASAWGSTAGARYSKDSQQSIGCLTYTNYPTPFVTCYAVDKTGKALVCSSTAPSIFTAVKAMTDFSHLSIFLRSDDSSSCQSVGVNNDSTYLR